QVFWRNMLHSDTTATASTPLMRFVRTVSPFLQEAQANCAEKRIENAIGTPSPRSHRGMLLRLRCYTAAQRCQSMCRHRWENVSRCLLQGCRCPYGLSSRTTLPKDKEICDLSMRSSAMLLLIGFGNSHLRSHESLKVGAGYSIGCWS